MMDFDRKEEIICSSEGCQKPTLSLMETNRWHLARGYRMISRASLLETNRLLSNRGRKMQGLRR